MDYDKILKPKGLTQEQHQHVMEVLRQPIDPLDAESAVEAFNEFDQSIIELKEQISTITVSDDATSRQVSELGIKAKRLANMISKRLDEKLQPYRNYISTVRNDVTRLFFDKIAEIVKIASDKNLPWLQEQNRKRIQAEQEAKQQAIKAQVEAEAKAQEMGLPVAPQVVPYTPMPVIKHKTEGGSQGLDTITAWRVTDFKALPNAAFEDIEKESHDQDGKAISTPFNVWIRRQGKAGVKHIQGVDFFEREVIKTRLK